MRPGVVGSWARPGRVLLLLSICCLWLLLTPVARADSWVRAETPNFLVYSSVGESETREYLEQLEAFKYLAEMMLGGDAKTQGAQSRFTIYLLGNSDYLRIIRPDFSRAIAGVYMHCVEGAQAFSLAPQWFGAERNFALIVLLHEYSHHLMFSRLRRFYPSWYVEGFAEYMSTTRLQRGSYQLGMRQEWRTPWLTSEQKWIDFDVMLDQKRFAEAVKKKQINGGQFYAQSWLLAHYMLSDSARTQAFNAYFDAMGRGGDGSKEFEKATGMTPAQLRTAMNSYRREYSALLVKVPDLPATSISISRLPADREDYILEEAALSTCPKEAYGRKLTEKLRAMRAKRTQDVHLRVALARAELLFGDHKAARQELEGLSGQDAEAFDVAYLLGRSYLAESQQPGDQQQEWKNKASEQFLKAYKLNKTDPPNLYHLSLSLDGEGAPSKSVVNAGTAAALLLPSVAEYAIHAAQVNLRNGDRDVAIRVLQPFASYAHQLDYAANVAAVINAIRENETTANLLVKLKDLGLPPKSDDEDDKDKDKDKDKEKDKNKDKGDEK